MSKINLSKILFSSVTMALLWTQSIQAKPLPEPDKYEKIKLTFSDTNSAKGQALIASLDSFYKVQITRGFNGSVLIGYKGQVLYERYYGVANRSQNKMWNSEVSSQLASTSKPFTATAVLWLEQNGYLNIDAPVQEILADFPYPNITTRMLLCHSSGIPDYVYVGLNYWKKNNLTMYNEDLLQVFKKHKPKLLFTPGSSFKYSNSNYAFLARIIEEVAQMRFNDFMKKFFFDPLGMSNTFVYDPEINAGDDITLGYKANWTVHGDMFADGVTGDKGVYSTVRDMYIWDQSFYQNVFLDPNTLTKAYTPQHPLKPGNEQRSYGLGWRMIIQPNNKIIFHNGNWHSNNTVFYRFIQDNFTIIILGNKYNEGIYRQVKPIYDIVKRHENITTTFQSEE